LNRPIAPQNPLNCDHIINKTIPSDNSSNSDNEPSCFEKIRDLKCKNPNNITCCYLNINSIRNKFNNLADMIDGCIDIVCIAETKLDSSFPKSNFLMSGYSTPFRLDVTEHSGGLLIFIKEHIISKQLTKYIIPKDLQIIPFEINLRKTKWLMIAIYRPPRTKESYFIEQLIMLIDYYSQSYDNVFLMGDFNMDTSSKFILPLLESHNLKSLNKKATCFKSVDGKCIDLFLTNKNQSFKFTNAFETGMSDHHLMLYTMFKMTYQKGAPQLISYRSYKNFDKDMFSHDLHNEISNIQIYEQFELTFANVLDRHAPIKSKFIRANEKPFINKSLKKAIMNRSRLRKKANKTGSQVDIENYKQQRNFITNLNRRIQKQYFKNLDPKNIRTSKSFFQSFKPFFSSKYTQREKMILVEDGNIISDDTSCAELMNHYLSHITDSLNIIEWPTTPEIELINNPLDKSIMKYSNHPSIINIQTEFANTSQFSFQTIAPEDIMLEVKKLDSSKGTSGNIPIKIVKDYIHLFLDPLNNCFKNVTNEYIFPDLLKLSDVTPAHKKGDKTDKENYRPISVLKVFAKILERILSRQLSEFITPKFSPLLCGFREGHSTQHALLKLLEDWRSRLESHEIVGTILCDLSKAFDTLPHDLLIAKLNAYGLDRNSLKLIDNYLTNRKQRCKVGSSFSTWSNIQVGVPQGSVLGPLLFNVFLNDIFFEIKQSAICNWADDNTLHAYGKNILEVKYKLENDLANTLVWFKSNRMVANPHKFQVMFLGTRKHIDLCLDINGKTSRTTKKVILLGISIDWNLNFNNHANEICSIANNKAKALARLRFKLNQDQKLTLYHSFIISNFGYCPLIWMFCGKTCNESINRVQRKALRAVHNDYTSNFSNLLSHGKHKTIHEMNKIKLLTQVYKCLENECPTFLSNLFVKRNVGYNLRRSNLLVLPKAKSHYGLNSIAYRGSMAWNNLSDNFKNHKNSNDFKESIEQQKTIKCNCQLCV